jgi:hypothetical protein
MSVDIGVVVISSALPLLGVLIGTGATIFGQRSSARESRIRSEEDRRQAQRAEIKSSISAYLEVAQHLQTQLYAREHGRETLDVPVMVEQIWVAHTHADIICSERLREPLVRHATVLNEVARHEERYPGWWAVVLPYKVALLNAVREELKWPEDISRHTAGGSGESTDYLDAYNSWLSEFEGYDAAR